MRDPSPCPPARGRTSRARGARPGRALGPVLGLGLGALGSAWAQAAPPANNYYRHDTPDGRVSITNVKRPGPEWKLYKRIQGSGGERGDSRPGAASRPKDFDLQGDRFHRYDAYIAGAARRYQIPESLIRAVIHTESNYYPGALSRVGAMGLMQLMPSTAAFLEVEDPWDPRLNIYGGTRLLRLLANRFNGDMVLVLAGYHAGAGNVQKYGGVPPFDTTRAYVKAVLRRYYMYEQRAQLGAKAGAVRQPARFIAE